MAREYVFSKEFTNPTAVTQLQIAAGTAMPIVIMRAWLTQRSSTTSTASGVQILRKSAAATVTAAVAADLRKLDPGDATTVVQLGTALTGYTASAEGTNGDIVHEEGFNILNGFYYEPQPELRATVPGGGLIALKLVVAITGTVQVGFVYAEGLSS